MERIEESFLMPTVEDNLYEEEGSQILHEYVCSFRSGLHGAI